MSFDSTTKKESSTDNRIEAITEKEVIGILTRAQNFEFSRQVQENLDCLSPLWNYYTDRPQIEPFSPPVQAEILLRCGAILSYYAHYKYLDYQNLARLWLNESVELFKSIGISDKIAEAETELAMTYWREGRNSEALGWLESASIKVTNDLNMVCVKNISYQLLVLFSLNTPQSLQAGSDLIREKDTCVELCLDNRVKVHYYNNSALLMTRIDQMGEALTRHHKCILYCKEINNQFSLAFAENNVGYIYNQLKEFDKAAEHTKKAITICQEIGISVREAECWDTLAQICLDRQIYLKSNDFSEAWQAISKSLEILLPIGFSKSNSKVAFQSGDSSLINSLQTKSKILLHQGKINEALTVFFTIFQAVPRHTAETSSREFSEMLEFIGGSSFADKTAEYERKLIEKAIISGNGNINKIAGKLEIALNDLVELFETRHSDLGKQYQVKISPKISGKSKNYEDLTEKKILSALNEKVNVGKEFLEKYDCLGFPAYIPTSVEVKFLMPIAESRLASIGLIEGRVAVVSSTISNNPVYPLVIREYINSQYHYGFRIDSMGLVGLEADNSDIYEMRVFDPEIVEFTGNIVGYCEFNLADKIYEFRPIKLV